MDFGGESFSLRELIERSLDLKRPLMAEPLGLENFGSHDTVQPGGLSGISLMINTLAQRRFASGSLGHESDETRAGNDEWDGIHVPFSLPLSRKQERSLAKAG